MRTGSTASRPPPTRPSDGPPDPKLVSLVEALARWQARKDYAARNGGTSK